MQPYRHFDITTPVKIESLPLAADVRYSGKSRRNNSHKHTRVIANPLSSTTTKGETFIDDFFGNSRSSDSYPKGVLIVFVSILSIIYILRGLSAALILQGSTLQRSKPEAFESRRRLLNSNEIHASYFC